MTDEQLLMQAIAEGDSRAFDAAVRQHLKSISYYAFRMLGNGKDTEDITQETFLRLWTHASRWNHEKASLSTWLHRIAHNLCIDYMRKDKSSISEDIDDAVELEHIEAESDETKERMAALTKAISGLGERQRSALVLNHYHGFSNKQVAQIMDISVDALESILARARRALKNQLVSNSTKENASLKTTTRIQEKL